MTGMLLEKENMQFRSGESPQPMTPCLLSMDTAVKSHGQSLQSTGPGPGVLPSGLRKVLFLHYSEAGLGDMSFFYETRGIGT